MSSRRALRRTLETVKARAPHPAPVSGPWAIAYWNLDDILLYTLRFFSIIELLHFSHTCQRTSTLAKIYLRGRIIRYTSPFFTKRSPMLVATSDIVLRWFFRTLEETRSWIVGSVPLAASALLSDVPCPNNLNIITRSRFLGEWITFLVYDRGFEMTSQATAAGPYARAGHLRSVFVHGDIPALSISVTTTEDSHLGALFFASPNTDQHIAIGAHELIMPFMKAVSNQEHLIGFRRYERRLHSVPEPPEDGLHRTKSRFPGAIILHPSTQGWTQPCGNICPGVQRFAKGLTGIAHVKWGGMDWLDDDMDPALEEIGSSGMIFRTGTRCQNPKCDNRRRRGLLEA
ncbi:hypothetical protein B0H11DRAFT_2261404 [Mycena galericulata]|nr:hypothetical protein B0H11DRAFT_2261404 [Mycena galericulata]